MARDQVTRPMTEDELAEVSKSIREQREEIRDYLASEGVDVSEWTNQIGDGVQGADRDTADSD